MHGGIVGHRNLEAPSRGLAGPGRASGPAVGVPKRRRAACARSGGGRGSIRRVGAGGRGAVPAQQRPCLHGMSNGHLVRDRVHHRDASVPRQDRASEAVTSITRVAGRMNAERQVLGEAAADPAGGRRAAARHAEDRRTPGPSGPPGAVDGAGAGSGGRRAGRLADPDPARARQALSPAQPVPEASGCRGSLVAGAGK